MTPARQACVRLPPKLVRPVSGCVSSLAPALSPSPNWSPPRRFLPGARRRKSSASKPGICFSGIFRCGRLALDFN